MEAGLTLAGRIPKKFTEKACWFKGWKQKQRAVKNVIKRESGVRGDDTSPRETEKDRKSTRSTS